MSDFFIPTSLRRGQLLLAPPLFESQDPDQTRDFVSRIFCAHRFDVLDNRYPFDTTITHVQIGRISINSFSYGADVSIDPGHLEDFYLLQMVLEGAEILKYGSKEFHLHPGLISVIGPDVSVKKSSPAGTRKLLVRIDRTLIEQICMQHLGHGLVKPLQFEVELMKNTGRGMNLGGLITFLHDQTSIKDSAFRSPLILANLEHLLTTTLLLSQQSNYSEEINSPVPPVSPGFVKRVEEFIDANADRPITIEDLSAHAGVSTRSLFAGFKKYRNTTPMAHLRFVRMQRAHRDLRSPPNRNTTVTEIALNWGFAHLGRFTAEYRKMFGESPSETLKQACR